MNISKKILNNNFKSKKNIEFVINDISVNNI